MADIYFCAGADILLEDNQKSKFCNDGVNMSAKTGKHILELLFPE